MNDGGISKEEHAYALGLWCADRYWWSSSIGLSNVEPELIVRFGHYLTKLLGRDRLRVRVYLVENEVPDRMVLMLTSSVSIVRPHKMKRTAYHVYVNSRPLIRLFQAKSHTLAEIPVQQLGSYFAGRFDGDENLGATPENCIHDSRRGRSR